VEETRAGIQDDDGDAPAAARPFTLASLALAVAVCAGWWVVALTAFFVYASGRSDTAAVPGCTGGGCPSERTALLTLGFFGLLPTAFVGLLVSLVVLVYGARTLRRPVPLGTASAATGMVLAAIGLITIATFEG
jgi:hypothetical protein